MVARLRAEASVSKRPEPADVRNTVE
jgi:hypothetical protein